MSLRGPALLIGCALAVTGLAFYFVRGANIPGEQTTTRPTPYIAKVLTLAIEGTAKPIDSSAGKDSSAKKAAQPQWSSFEIPSPSELDFPVARWREQASKLFELNLGPTDAQPGETRHPIKDHYVVERYVEGIGETDRMYEASSDALSSERWTDKELGQVKRFHHPEFFATSLDLGTKSKEVSFIRIPRDDIFYAKEIRGTVTRYFYEERGRKTFYSHDKSQGRLLLSHDEELARQYWRDPEGGWQEIDSNGNLLGRYEFRDGVLVSIP